MAAHTLTTALALLVTLTLTEVSRCQAKDFMGVLRDIQQENSAYKMRQRGDPLPTSPSPVTGKTSKLWPSLTSKQYRDPNRPTATAPTAPVPTRLPQLPRDCQDLWELGYTEPGVFTIYPLGSYGVQVWCQHSLYDTATVFQRRQFGNVSFARPLHDYQIGFGHASGDHWLGLTTLHLLTYQGNMKLSIALQDWQGVTKYMVYNLFKVGDKTTHYRLTIGQAQGPLADDMAFSNGMPFSTWDYPDQRSCASTQQAGWWYNYCAYALLNGKFYYGGAYHPPGGMYDGIYWKDWYGYDYSLKFVSMALVRKY